MIYNEIDNFPHITHHQTIDTDGERWYSKWLLANVEHPNPINYAQQFDTDEHWWKNSF